MEQDRPVIKARLVARGFEEENLNDIRKDSPTCSKENLRIVLAIISSHQWQASSLDVKSAFLQGNQIDRDLYLKPPKEADTGNLWKLKTTVYGLSDASRVWYLRVKEELFKVGTEMCKYDEAIFYWRSQNILQGIISCHVDDFCWSGTELFKKKVIDVITEKFHISQEESLVFKYVGIHLSQQRDGSITIHQHDYISDIQLIDIDRERALMKKDPLTAKESQQLKAVAGQLNWVSSQTRPDISFDSCQVSVSCKDATIEDLFKANESVKKLKLEHVSLQYPNLGSLKEARIVGYNDAAFANLKDSGSQGGFIIFLAGSNGNYAPIHLQSKKIKRVVKSTIAAETLELLEAAEHCFFTRTVLCEIYKLNAKEDVLPVHLLTDNHSLYEAAYSTKTLSDKRLKIDICIIREMLSTGDIKEIECVPKELQLADCLTESGASPTKLLSVLSGNGLF